MAEGIITSMDANLLAYNGGGISLAKMGIMFTILHGYTYMVK